MTERLGNLQGSRWNPRHEEICYLLFVIFFLNCMLYSCTRYFCMHWLPTLLTNTFIKIYVSKYMYMYLSIVCINHPRSDRNQYELTIIILTDDKIFIY